MIRLLGCSLMILMIARTMLSSRSVEPWIEHNARVARFVCNMPQPRSFKLSEILPSNSSLRTTAGTIYPQRTVLYRCEHAGCCKGIKRCLPHQIDEVRLVFAVSIPRKDPHYVQITANNHTACSCQDKKDKPK